MEEMTGTYFIRTGSVAFVVASSNNAIVQRFSRGSVVGFEDLPYFLH